MHWQFSTIPAVVVLKQNPKSSQSETKTRPSTNAVETETETRPRPSKNGPKTGLKTKTSLDINILIV